MKRKIPFGLLCLTIILMGIIPAAHAASVTIETNKNTYEPGDKLGASGTVSPIDTNQGVTIQVTGPSGFPGAFAVVLPNVSGSWSTSNIVTFIATYPAGTYKVTAKYAGSSTSTEVQFAIPGIETDLPLSETISISDKESTSLSKFLEKSLQEVISVLDKQTSSKFDLLTKTVSEIISIAGQTTSNTLTDSLEILKEAFEEVIKIVGNAVSTALPQLASIPVSSDESFAIAAKVDSVYKIKFQFLFLQLKAEGKTEAEIETTSNIESIEAKQDAKVVKINLIVSGESGTKGITIIKVPVEVANFEINITVNGKSAQYKVIKEDAYAYIHIEYSHSEVEIIISISPKAADNILFSILLPEIYDETLGYQSEILGLIAIPLITWTGVGFAVGFFSRRRSVGAIAALIPIALILYDSPSLSRMIFALPVIIGGIIGGSRIRKKENDSTKEIVQ